MTNKLKQAIDFGSFVNVEMKRHFCSNEQYLHKVIGRLQSNTWVDTPIQTPATETIHSHVEEVVNLVCCGVVEDYIYRVKLSDVTPISQDELSLGEEDTLNT